MADEDAERLNNIFNKMKNRQRDIRKQDVQEQIDECLEQFDECLSFFLKTSTNWLYVDEINEFIEECLGGWEKGNWYGVAPWIKLK